MSATPPDLLVLLDIDGTLVYRASREHAESVIAAIQEVHGPLELSPVAAAGLTDRRIVRSLLTAAGLTDAQIDADMEWLLAIAVRQYEVRCPDDLSGKVLPGIPELLAELSVHPEIQLGLLTGNVEPIAHRKLSAAGISRPLLPWLGAYGSDAEDRNQLVPVAQERAAALYGMLGPWPSERTVIVGDTPHDIACARAVGAKVIGVTTGAFERADLQEADVVVDDSSQLAAELLRLVAA